MKIPSAGDCQKSQGVSSTLNFSWTTWRKSKSCSKNGPKVLKKKTKSDWLRLACKAGLRQRPLGGPWKGSRPPPGGMWIVGLQLCPWPHLLTNCPESSDQSVQVPQGSDASSPILATNCPIFCSKVSAHLSLMTLNRFSCHSEGLIVWGRVIFNGKWRNLQKTVAPQMGQKVGVPERAARRQGAWEAGLLLGRASSALTHPEQEGKLLDPSWWRSEASWRAQSSSGFSLNRGSSYMEPRLPCAEMCLPLSLAESLLCFSLRVEFWKSLLFFPLLGLMFSLLKLFPGPTLAHDTSVDLESCFLK